MPAACPDGPPATCWACTTAGETPEHHQVDPEHDAEGKSRAVYFRVSRLGNWLKDLECKPEPQVEPGTTLTPEHPEGAPTSRGLLLCWAAGTGSPPAPFFAATSPASSSTWAVGSKGTAKELARGPVHSTPAPWCWCSFVVSVWGHPRRA